MPPLRLRTAVLKLPDSGRAIRRSSSASSWSLALGPGSRTRRWQSTERPGLRWLAADGPAGRTGSQCGALRTATVLPRRRALCPCPAEEPAARCAGNPPAQQAKRPPRLVLRCHRPAPGNRPSWPLVWSTACASAGEPELRAYSARTAIAAEYGSIPSGGAMGSPPTVTLPSTNTSTRVAPRSITSLLKYCVRHTAPPQRYYPVPAGGVMSRPRFGAFRPQTKNPGPVWSGACVGVC